MGPRLRCVTKKGQHKSLSTTQKSRVSLIELCIDCPDVTKACNTWGRQGLESSELLIVLQVQGGDGYGLFRRKQSFLMGGSSLILSQEVQPRGINNPMGEDVQRGSIMDLLTHPYFALCLHDHGTN